MLPGGTRAPGARAAVKPQQAGQRPFQQMPGGHQAQEGQGIAKGADGAGDSEGARLEHPQQKGVAGRVRVEIHAVLAAEAQREHAAGGGQFDPDRIERPVRRRVGRPGEADGPSGQTGGDGEG